MNNGAGTGLLPLPINEPPLTLANIGNSMRPEVTPLNNVNNFNWAEARAQYETLNEPVIMPHPAPAPISKEALVGRFSKVLGLSIDDTTEAIDNLNPAVPLSDFFGSLFNRIPKLEARQGTSQGTSILTLNGSNRNTVISESIGSGAHGNIYISSDKKRVYKYIRKEFKEGTSMTKTAFFEKVLREIFFEAFVQTILSSDPIYGRFITSVQGIYHKPSENPNSRTVIIQMPSLQYNLKIAIDSYVSSRKHALKYIRLRHILKSLTEALVHFKNMYGFHHRDFHMGNIMFADSELRKPMIIDFGKSCLTFSGVTYSYNGNPCESNDMLQLVVDILQHSDYTRRAKRLFLDDYTVQFLREAVICARHQYNFYDILAGRYINKYPTLFHAIYYSEFRPGRTMYNYFMDNGLIPLPNINTPEAFLKFIENNDKKEIELAETPVRRRQMGDRDTNGLLENLRKSTSMFRYPLKREAGTRRLVGGKKRSTSKRTRRRIL